jgi:hypothetical protein
METNEAGLTVGERLERLFLHLGLTRAHIHWRSRAYSRGARAGSQGRNTR